MTSLCVVVVVGNDVAVVGSLLSSDVTGDGRLPWFVLESNKTMTVTYLIVLKCGTRQL